MAPFTFAVPLPADDPRMHAAGPPSPPPPAAPAARPRPVPPPPARDGLADDQQQRLHEAPQPVKRGWAASYGPAAGGSGSGPQAERRDLDDDFDAPPPPKRRRGLTSTLIDVTLSAAVLGAAVTYTAYRLWRDRGVPDEQLAPADDGLALKAEDSSRAQPLSQPATRRRPKVATVGRARASRPHTTARRPSGESPPPTYHSLLGDPPLTFASPPPPASLSRSPSTSASIDARFESLEEKMSRMIAEARAALSSPSTAARSFAAPSPELPHAQPSWDGAGARGFADEVMVDIEEEAGGSWVPLVGARSGLSGSRSMPSFASSSRTSTSSTLHRPWAHGIDTSSTSSPSAYSYSPSSNSSRQSGSAALPRTRRGLPSSYSTGHLSACGPDRASVLYDPGARVCLSGDVACGVLPARTEEDEGRLKELLARTSRSYGLSSL